MPTSKPRVMVTMEPAFNERLKYISDQTGYSLSQVVNMILDHASEEIILAHDKILCMTENEDYDDEIPHQARRIFNQTMYS